MTAWMSAQAGLALLLFRRRHAIHDRPLGQRVPGKHSTGDGMLEDPNPIPNRSKEFSELLDHPPTALVPPVQTSKRDRTWRHR
ncbi:hypothetical protein PAHAL_3G110700 [Panicum hallii]|uniref:Uncharacterized protein n=1 Tax=Panicum hallii TaxID=206008 RepID=A0A2S3H7X2_9POAL|nr:hypothetical protein PAHAL_3G110700 [Panicum hallii]